MIGLGDFPLRINFYHPVSAVHSATAAIGEVELPVEFKKVMREALATAELIDAVLVALGIVPLEAYQINALLDAPVE